jgi:hypothetical protein
LKFWRRRVPYGYRALRFAGTNIGQVLRLGLIYVCGAGVIDMKDAYAMGTYNLKNIVLQRILGKSLGEGSADKCR